MHSLFANGSTPRCRQSLNATDWSRQNNKKNIPNEIKYIAHCRARFRAPEIDVSLKCKVFFSLLILIKLSYLRMHNVHIVQFLYFFCLHCLCIVHISDSFDTGAYSCMQIDNISYFRCNSNIYIEASAECNRHIVTNGQMLNGEMKTRRTRIWKIIMKVQYVTRLSDT